MGYQLPFLEYEFLTQSSPNDSSNHYQRQSGSRTHYHIQCYRDHAYTSVDSLRHTVLSIGRG